jgi:hypothetical protein
MFGKLIPAEYLVMLLGFFSLLFVLFQAPIIKDAINISSQNQATLSDYWQGKAELKLYEKLDYEYRNATQIKVVNGNWYLFYRGGENISGGCNSWLTASLDTRVVKSTDQGKTWSAPVIVAPNELGKPWECAANDGDAYYDASQNKWHLLVQCATADRVWHACHFTKDGSDPMGRFTPDAQNPINGLGSIWQSICDNPNDDCYQLAHGNNVSEAGTFDIFQKSNGYYYVGFHGAYNDAGRGMGFRGIAKTRDFVNWEAGKGDLPSDSIFDAKDSLSWKEDWQGYNAAGGAGNILYDNGYYYLFVEASAQGINCIPGQHWTAGVLRSSSLSNSNWEQLPQGNPIVYSYRSPGRQTAPCPIQYVGFFKDDQTGKIYMHYSQQDDDHSIRGVYVAELVKVGGETPAIVPVIENPIAISIPVAVATPTPTPTPIIQSAAVGGSNPDQGICKPGQTFYSCSDVKCPNGSTPPGGGCYPDSYLGDCLARCSNASVVVSQPTPAPINIPAIEITVSQPVYSTPAVYGGSCHDDCFSDDLRTNVGTNPVTNRCDSGYSSVSHFCNTSNVGVLQACGGGNYRCVNGGPSGFYWYPSGQ